MQSLIIDTNVIVSALISKGIPSKIISELVLEQKVKLHISTEIFSEYVEVLLRPKFKHLPGFRKHADIVISRIEELGIYTEVTQTLDIIKDESDNRFLELALACKADFLITGNTNDFLIEKINTTKIVTPTEYWNNYRPEI